jgi:hypothetical protein
VAVHTHYDVLKVTRTAPLEVIRAAYRALAQKHHPDRCATIADGARATREMQVINRAWEVLSDPFRRTEHNAWIARQEAPRAQTPHAEPTPTQAAPEPARSPEPPRPRPRPPEPASEPSRGGPNVYIFAVVTTGIFVLGLGLAPAMLERAHRPMAPATLERPPLGGWHQPPPQAPSADKHRQQVAKTITKWPLRGYAETEHERLCALAMRMERYEQYRVHSGPESAARASPSC